ncbi:hypothetical protein ACFLYC_01200 [Chloroflexota bacterium]
MLDIGFIRGRVVNSLLRFDRFLGARFFGIHIRIHYTWIIAIALTALAVVTQFPTEYYHLWLRILFGVSAGIIFFIAILLRELVLSFISTEKGVVVRQVTLFAFGGLSEVDKETTTSAVELLLAVSGMLYNLVIAVAFLVAYVALAQSSQPAVDVLLKWLAFIFFMLALLHILPGYPLDTGRILRAIIWKSANNYERATRITSWVGVGIGLLLGIGGLLLLILTQEQFAGVFLLAVGLILQSASRYGWRRVGKASQSPD